jgi:CubicO group peptidase (beta-lactamase class C family)
MSAQKMKSSTGRRYIYIISIMILVLVTLPACGPSSEELAAVNYAPTSTEDWEVSTPEEQGLDPDLIAQLFYNASKLPKIYSLKVFKNDYLIAEDYFNAGSAEQRVNIHSVTKSINSALVGLALEQGCITSLDQKMVEFFPELVNRINDPRKKQITIQQMLQMRAGYPWEEATAEGTDLLFSGFRPSNLVDVPLAYDPGSGSAYSNLTAHLLGIIVARACNTDLKSFAQEHLFDPLGIEPAFWQVDWEGNYLGYSDVHLSSTDLAKFGLLYLNDGNYMGTQVVPADWVHDSLQIYSKNTWTVRVGRNWDDNAYGYQWWSIRAGKHRYNLAWGHGGQQIVLLKDLDMVIVVTNDPLHMQHGDEPWKIEKQSLNLVANFIATLPTE